MLPKLALIAIGASYLLLADDSVRQKVQVRHTEHVDFPANGVLRLKNSTGTVTVEAWDQPDVEITTMISTKTEYTAAEHEQVVRELDRVRISANRDGDELVVTMDSPRHPGFPFASDTNFDLECTVKVPANARLVANHDVGEVNVDGLSSDITVNLLQGEILLHLPEDGKYDIHAKSDFGGAFSDFPAPEKRTWWLVGHRAVNQDPQAPHKLNLKVGFGDIIILKTRIPKAPGPLAPAAKTDGE